MAAGMTHDEKRRVMAGLAAAFAAAVCDAAEDGGDSRMATEAEQACDKAAEYATTPEAQQAWLAASSAWLQAATAWDTEEELGEDPDADEDAIEAAEDQSALSADHAAAATSRACQASGIDPVPPTIG